MAFSPAFRAIAQHLAHSRPSVNMCRHTVVNEIYLPRELTVYSGSKEVVNCKTA